MALPLTFVGVDVSKAWLDVWTGAAPHPHRLANDDAGWAELARLLAALGPPAGVVVAFEATGGYERGLREALLRAGYDARLLNPLRVRLFARSIGRQAKNDRIDARVIAHDARVAETRPERLDAQQERLAELVQHRRRLVEERVAVANQAGLLRQDRLKAHHEARLALIARQIAETERLIGAAVGEVPGLADKVALLKSMKGIQDLTAVTLLALMPELGRLTGRAAAALAGLAPFDHDSGKRKGTRCIGGGRAPVRTALYMAARAAARSKSPLGAFYQRLISGGKTSRVATVALMRKMLVTANAILRDGTKWSHAQAAKAV